MAESSIVTMAANGDLLSVRVPSEDAVENLAFILAVSGANPDDRVDADLCRANITDAQRAIVRQHLILSMNGGIA